MQYNRVFHSGVLVLVVLLALASGCAVVGPESIRNGRNAYNAAVTETNNRQMLMVLVRRRYEESSNLLTVASITANVRVSAGAESQAGFGDEADYLGNIVPFSGSIAYEENPTVSYIPVAGGAYLREFMQPLPLAVFARIAQAMSTSELPYTMLVNTMNGVPNPLFSSAARAPDQRFAQLQSLSTELTGRHCLRWLVGAGGQASVELDPAQRCSQDLQVWLDVLGIAHDRAPVPRRIAVTESRADPGELFIATRSIWELVELLSAAVEVPAADVERGVAEAPLQMGPAGRDLRIAYSASAPEEAYVAVEYRGGWYYIDDRDLATKRYFRYLGSLWGAAMARALESGGASKPVLTVPVSR